MDTVLTHLGVADAILLRQCLLYYESHLSTAPREGESDEVSLAVVQTIESLRRLDRRLSVSIRHVDRALDARATAEGDDSDIPF